MIVPTLAFILTTGLGAIFLASAIPKLRRPKSFVLVVVEYQVMPEHLARLVGWTLPPIELGLDCLLLLGVVPAVGSVAAALLLAGFIVGVTVNLARGRRITCGCFGTHRMIAWPLLLQDAVLLGTSALAVALSRPEGMAASWSVLRVVDAPSRLPLLSLLACAAVLGTVAFRTLGERTTPVRRAGASASGLSPQIGHTAHRTRRSS